MQQAGVPRPVCTAANAVPPSPVGWYAWAWAWAGSMTDPSVIDCSAPARRRTTAAARERSDADAIARGPVRPVSLRRRVSVAAAGRQPRRGVEGAVDWPPQPPPHTRLLR